MSLCTSVHLRRSTVSGAPLHAQHTEGPFEHLTVHDAVDVPEGAYEQRMRARGHSDSVLDEKVM
jgi:hypothetical protein